MIDPALDFNNITSVSAIDIKEALDAGVDLTNLVGKNVSCRWNNEVIDWDVADYDDTNKTVTLLLHNCLAGTFKFDSTQALVYCDSGLSAGNHKFADNGTYYYFTLTEAIPAGGQLVANTSRFTTYASQESTEALETGTVSTTELQNAAFLGTCGGGSGQGALNNLVRANGGSNNFAESGLFQWLNSSAPAGAIMPMVTKFNRPYSVNKPGFLGALDYGFAMCLDNTVWKCSGNNAYECPESRGGVATANQRYTVTGKIGLASEKEIYGSYSGTTTPAVDAGDTVFDLYRHATNADRKKTTKTGGSFYGWWLRSPAPGSSFSERSVDRVGAADSVTANATSSYGGRVVPACKISKT